MPGAVRAQCQGSLVKPASLPGHHYKLLHTCRRGNASYRKVCVCVCVCISVSRVQRWFYNMYFGNFMTSLPVLIRLFQVLMTLNKQIIEENCCFQGGIKLFLCHNSEVWLKANTDLPRRCNWMNEVTTKTSSSSETSNSWYSTGENMNGAALRPTTTSQIMTGSPSFCNKAKLMLHRAADRLFVVATFLFLPLALPRK